MDCYHFMRMNFATYKYLSWYQDPPQYNHKSCAIKPDYSQEGYEYETEETATDTAGDM